MSCFAIMPVSVSVLSRFLENHLEPQNKVEIPFVLPKT